MICLPGLASLARLASAWLVPSTAATTTATTPVQASTTIAAARSAAPIVFYACSGVVAVVVAAADETSHAKASRAKPSQASQSSGERLTNGIGYFVICDRHKACLIAEPPVSDKSHDLMHGRQEGGSSLVCLSVFPGIK